MPAQIPPKAILFDVFGTVVDWRTSIEHALSTHIQTALADSQRDIPLEIRQRATALTPKDWQVFAQQWRQGYLKFTQNYDFTSQEPFVTIDEHHLQSLQQLLKQWNIDGLLTEEETQELSLAWHDLIPWPDSAEGLARLNKKFATSTLSNGNVSLLQDLKTNGSLPFTHITSAEEFGAYKPAPAVYDGGARKLGLQSSECALVAAHLYDLRAAKDRGFQTIYVERSQEESFTDAEMAQAKKDGWVDLWIDLSQDGFRAVAAHFGL